MHNLKGLLFVKKKRSNQNLYLFIIKGALLIILRSF